MSDTRLKEGMTLDEVVAYMSDGDPGGFISLVEIVTVYKERYKNLDGALLNIITLDRHHIYGRKILVLWKVCCNSDIDTFREVVLAIGVGKISDEELNENLCSKYPVPFSI